MHEGALNPHLAFQRGVTNCTSLPSVATDHRFLLHGLFEHGLTDPAFTKKKTQCFALGFLFGGNEGARTHDLTDVNRAL